MPIPAGKGIRQYDAKAVSDAESVDTGDESLVQQHLKEEVDVNMIVRRFGLTGDLPSWNREGIYGDFTGVSDFDSAVERISRTQEAFMALSAEVRDHFKNDPSELVRYAQSVSEAEFDRTLSGLAPGAPVESAPGGAAPVSDEPA